MKGNDKFFTYLREFLTIYLPQQRRCSPNTVKSYRDAINLYRTFLLEYQNVPFAEITFELFNYHTANEFLNWLQTSRGCSISSRNQRLAAINSFLNYAAIHDPALMDNYVKVKNIPVKKFGKQPLKYMSEEAIAAVFRQPNIFKRNGCRDRFFMILLYDTGARVQEILDLRLGDFNLNSSNPYVYLTGKGEKTRQIPLMDKTVGHLMAYLNEFHPNNNRKPEAHLFYTVIKGKTGPMSPENVASFIRRYGKSAKKECSDVPDNLHAHIYRHSRAMALYKSGVPLSYIKEFLGHSHINTTSVYAITDMAMMRNALEKTSYCDKASPAESNWEGDEEMILRLCGLK